MQKIRWFFLILAIVVAITLALQNNQLTAIHLFWLETPPMPLSVLMLTGMGAGFLLGAIVTATMLRSRRKREKEKQAKAAAGGNDTLPGADPADGRLGA